MTLADLSMVSHFSHGCPFATPRTVAYQAPLSLELSHQEYWSGMSFPPPGDLPHPGIKPALPHCRQIPYHLSHQGSPLAIGGMQIKIAGDLDGKESTFNAGDLGSVPGWGRSSGGGHGNPLQYFYLENPMDRGAWWATVHGIAKSQTRLK